MAKLVLTRDGKVVNQFFIETPSITVGRDEANDIVIPDPLLSRVHMSIIKLGNDAIVEDLQSRNGSKVNGKPLARQILQHLDIIDLGSYQLRYMSSGIAADADFDRTMFIQTLARPAGPKVVAEVAAAVIDVPLAPSAKAKAKLAEGSVEVVEGEAPYLPGQIVQLERVVTTFGVPGERLVVLTRRPHGIFLTHVEGAKTPRVNRQSIGYKPYALKRDDEIEAAGYRLKFSL